MFETATKSIVSKEVAHKRVGVVDPAVNAAHTSSEVEQFRMHRWAQRIARCRKMGLTVHEESWLHAGPPFDWQEHLSSGPGWLRSNLLETLPKPLLIRQIPELVVHWRRWDAEAWGRALPILAEKRPEMALAEMEFCLDCNDGLPRGSIVPWMVQALMKLGPRGRPLSLDWARNGRLCGVPLEYLWSGHFGLLAHFQAPGLAQMLLQTFQVFAPGARDVDQVLRSVFEALAPGIPTWNLVMGLRQGGGYLLEDLPEVFEQGPKSRAVDDLMVDARGPQLSEVASLLSKTAESPSVLTRLALQLLRYAELGRWSAHADRIALFGLAAAAATCVRDKPMLDGMSVPDLLGLLSADIQHLPGEESLVAETYARLEDRHLPLLEKELDQARVSSGLTRLVLLVRRLRQPRLAASLVPLLSRKTAPDAASSAAGGLVELGPVVLPELERAYESMDFEGKALALDIMGFLDCPESGACLGRRVRGALADTELLDRWALSASWLGHQDLKTTARRWAACAPWPLQALADL